MFPTLPPNAPACWLDFVLPVGSVIAYAGRVDPKGPLDPSLPPQEQINPALWGWLLCDGSTFHKEDYPYLATALGSETLPDYQGYFLRGAGPSPPVPKNPTNSDTIVVGDEQDFTLYSHTHSYQLASPGSGGSSTPTNDEPPTGPHISTQETRPVNIAVNYLIRATYVTPWPGTLSPNIFAHEEHS